MARYLAVADLHLGAGADLGLAAGDRLAEQAAVWQQIIGLAGDRNVDAILFAGDAFHRNKPTPAEQMAFAVPLAHCRIPVFAINGNSHDFVGVDQAMAVSVVDTLSDWFSLFTEPAVVGLPGGVALAMLPWAPVSRIVAAQDGGDRDGINELAAELLIEVARGLASRCAAEHPGKPALLMTHFSISGAALPSGLSIDMAREPILPLADLELLGFDAIAAGHIHKPQLMESQIGRAMGPIFYCGSPAPLSFGEPGEHGCWLIEADVAGRLVPEFVPLSSRQFVTLEAGVDLEALSPLDGAFVKVRGSMSEEEYRRFDTGGTRALLMEWGAYSVEFKIEVERAHRERGSVLDDAGSRIDQLAAFLEASGTNGDVAPAMLERAAGYIA